MTISFLPAFSLPYTHYSLVARSEALRRRFLEGRSWEDAAPLLKDPDRVPVSSTLRRWCHSLGVLGTDFAFLRQALKTIAQLLEGGKSPGFGFFRLSWLTLYPCLRVVWPWPLRL